MTRLLLPSVLLLSVVDAFAPNMSSLSIINRRKQQRLTPLHGWLDNFLPKQIDDEAFDFQRRQEYPEQYPATYELSDVVLSSDDDDDAKLVRPLLKQTTLESRPLQVAYDAELHGWNPASFHQRVDGKGSAVVLATFVSSSSTMTVGGYNPKGYSSNGGSRPSVAAFLFYEQANNGLFQKLRKVGGGGLACARDDPDYGIAFGPDGLVIALQSSGGRERLASSKLGTYFERGPQDLPSIFNGSGTVQLETLKVLVGVYGEDEEIPYSGAVMDMTSG